MGIVDQGNWNRMKSITITLFLSLGLVSTLPFLPLNYNPAYYPVVYPTYQQVRQPENIPSPPPTAAIVINIDDVDFACIEEGLFLDTKALNCRNYIQCFLDNTAEGGFITTNNTCPPTLAFNSLKGSCDFDYNIQSNVECNTGSRKAPIPQVSPVIVEVHELCKGLTGNGAQYIVDPEDCTKYQVCAGDGQPHPLPLPLGQCPADTIFDPTSVEICVAGQCAPTITGEIE